MTARSSRTRTAGGANRDPAPWAYDLAAGDARAILRGLCRGVVRAAHGLLRGRTQKTKPLRLLQMIRAMTMVDDHLLNDIGLNRTAIVMIDRMPDGANARHLLRQSSW